MQFNTFNEQLCSYLGVGYQKDIFQPGVVVFYTVF